MQTLHPISWLRDACLLFSALGCLPLTYCLMSRFGLPRVRTRRPGFGDIYLGGDPRQILLESRKQGRKGKAAKSRHWGPLGASVTHWPAGPLSATHQGPRAGDVHTKLSLSWVRRAGRMLLILQHTKACHRHGQTVLGQGNG